VNKGDRVTVLAELMKPATTAAAATSKPPFGFCAP